jgi:hypothetical protein
LLASRANSDASEATSIGSLRPLVRRRLPSSPLPAPAIWRWACSTVSVPDQVLGPVDVHLALFPANSPGVFEAEDIGEIALARVRPAKLSQPLHTELPELLGGGMSQCFHGLCSLRQAHCKEGRNDCKRGANACEFLGKIV